MAGASVITDSPLGPARGRVNSGARFWPSALAVARRTVLKFVRTPQLIGLATVQSAIFLVIFRYIFGGAINAGGLPYVDFLVPGFVVTGFCGRAWVRQREWPRTSNRAFSTGCGPCRSPAQR